MADEIELRGYRADDLQAMYALDLVCFAESFRFSRVSMKRSAETAKARVVIAERSGEIVGFAIEHVERVKGGGAGYVVTLDVSPEERRKGLASVLMRRLEREAVAAGCAAVVLHAFTGNEAAIRFYERIGYQRCELAKGFYGAGLDGWVYRKSVGLSVSPRVAEGGAWTEFQR